MFCTIKVQNTTIPTKTKLYNILQNFMTLQHTESFIGYYTALWLFNLLQNFTTHYKILHCTDL